MDVSSASHEVVRLEFPDWIVHQLMRILPHVDAALQHGPATPGDAVVAYPVLSWSATSKATEPGVCLYLRDSRHVQAVYDLDLEAAIALQQALGQAIEGAAAASAGRQPEALVN